MNTLLLDTLADLSVPRPPVWLMRQAGRYMPEYQALRKKHSLLTLFHEPDLASLVTLLPIQAFDLDAAIVFSDILVITEVLGCTLSFPSVGGPKICPQISLEDKIESIPLKCVRETLSYVLETIALVKREASVPVIGFCGGPFTVATYLGFEDISLWLSLAPGPLHELLEKITQATEIYIEAQIDAGVSVIQIFDSWASKLNKQQRSLFCYPYIQRLLRACKKRGVPTIFFCRDSSLFPEELINLDATALSFDWHRPLAQLRERVPSPICVQGNLDPEILLRAGRQEVEYRTRQLVASMKGKKGWIANLGHGVLPETPVDNVRAFIETIREESYVTT